MRTNKSKKGISLIVLIITIIVMIILAAAIILSISNSGIMDKANKAKTDSDTANLKEYVNVLEAEWELEVENASDQTKTEYINTKLAEKGYNRKVTEEGVLLTESATKAIDAGIQIGDVVKYDILTAKTYTPNSEKTGATNSELTTQTNLTWIYIGINDNGELLITPDVSNGVPANSDVELYGKQGWLTGPEELNTICDKLYTVSGKGTARSMDIDDVTRILGYTGAKGVYYDSSNGNIRTTEAKRIGDIEKEVGTTLSNRSVPESGKNLEDYYSDYYFISELNHVKEMKNSKYVDLVFTKSEYYWLASACVDANFYAECAAFRIRYVGGSWIEGRSLFNQYTYEYEGSISIRPIVSLESNIQKSTENGSTVWSFE